MALSDAQLHTRLRRPGLAATLGLLLAMAVVASGCSLSSTTNMIEPQAASDTTAVAQQQGSAEPQDALPTAKAVAAQDQDQDQDTNSPAPPETAPTATPNPFAEGAVALPQAPIGFENIPSAEAPGPLPVALRIESLAIADADVIPVGVNDDDLSFEVPPADQVGWYEFGSLPGSPGSAVLAAHIAYNGVDGVFRDLSEVEIGAVVEIDFDDGTSQRYRIATVTDYLKEELPESLFERTGTPQLALITCGGSFNRQLSTYESNTVAIAIPL